LNRGLIIGVARPRTITDERILAAAGAVISRLGPAFTLADVAGEAGVAAGTLVHRFGSRHGLLVAMTGAAIGSIRQEMRTAAAGVDDPVAAIVRALTEPHAALDDPGTAANNLAQLAADLADDELRGLVAELWAGMEAELRPLLRRAAAAGCLPGAPPVALAARILTALADGTAIHWSARPAGGLCQRLRAELEAVLAGWRSRPST
jgi:AcrR family transcriptional regulator